jgi:hypothetical protein
VAGRSRGRNSLEAKCREIVAKRSDGLCERCGCEAHSFHHRVKRGQGGPWSPENVVHLCGHGTVGCHGWVEGNPNLAEAEGFHVRPWNDPSRVALVTPQGYMVLFDSLGNIERI